MAKMESKLTHSHYVISGQQYVLTVDVHGQTYVKMNCSFRNEMMHIIKERLGQTKNLNKHTSYFVQTPTF